MHFVILWLFVSLKVSVLSLSVFPSVSVLQPKCGFIPFSSDVTHDMKHRVCRYCMHQHLKVGRAGQLLLLLRALG